MQRNPCYARLFADLPYTPPNPIIASGGCGPRTPKGFSTGCLLLGPRRFCRRQKWPGGREGRQDGTRPGPAPWGKAAAHGLRAAAAGEDGRGRPPWGGHCPWGANLAVRAAPPCAQHRRARSTVRFSCTRPRPARSPCAGCPRTWRPLPDALCGRRGSGAWGHSPRRRSRCRRGSRRFCRFGPWR